MELETCGEEHDPQTEFTVMAGEPLTRPPARLPAQDKLPAAPSHAQPIMGGLWLHLHPSETPLKTGCGKETSLHGPLPDPHVFLLLLLPTQTTNSAQALLHE